MQRTQRFTITICILLVVVVTVIILKLGSSPNASLIAGLVSENKQAGQSSHQSAQPELGPQAAQGHPLDPALKIARDALEKFEREVDDYTATMVKRERVGGSLGNETRMEIKIRTRRIEGDKLVRPLQVYVKMLDPWLARGREVVWVENRNQGKLIAHEGGFKNIMRVTLAPTDQLAMLGNRYPITEIGLSKLMEKLVEKGERDKLMGPCEVTIQSGSEVAGRRCQVIEVKHPERDPRFDFHIARIFLDEERMIPLRYAAYLWPDKPGDAPPLEEEYTYLDVRLNVGLQDIDFDPDNPAYNF